MGKNMETGAWELDKASLAFPSMYFGPGMVSGVMENNDTKDWAPALNDLR